MPHPPPRTKTHAFGVDDDACYHAPVMFPILFRAALILIKRYMVISAARRRRWKPFDDVGAGTREIRIKDASGIYRVMYVAKFEEAIYVLHCFQKKTQVTSKKDKAIASARYRAVVSGRKETK